MKGLLIAALLLMPVVGGAENWRERHERETTEMLAQQQRERAWRKAESEIQLREARQERHWDAIERAQEEEKDRQFWRDVEERRRHDELIQEIEDSRVEVPYDWDTWR